MIMLVLNKDMPNSCRECFIRMQCPQWNRRSLWKEEYIYKRSDNCPLHEIDAPTIIEADKAEGSKK